VDSDLAETGQPYAFTGDDPLNETDPTGSIVNQGPGRPIAGNSAASAVAADNIDSTDQINAVITNSGAYYAKNNTGSTSDLVVNGFLAAGMLVPGFDDGPDEALMGATDAAEEAAERAAADEGTDATKIGVSGAASHYDIDELAQLTYQHIGEGDIPGRPSLGEIESALRNAAGQRLEGQNAVQFEYDGVRVIINEDLPTRSTAYYPGG
jgi:hypothetical protein